MISNFERVDLLGDGDIGWQNNIQDDAKQPGIIASKKELTRDEKPIRKVRQKAFLKKKLTCIFRNTSRGTGTPDY